MPCPSAQGCRNFPNPGPQFGSPLFSLSVKLSSCTLHRNTISRFLHQLSLSSPSLQGLNQPTNTVPALQYPFTFPFHLNLKFLFSSPFYYTKPRDHLEINKPKHNNCWLGRSPMSFFPGLRLVYFIFFWSFTLGFIFIFLICSEFCHTLKWNSHGFTCVPHPDPPSHFPLHPLPLGLPSTPGPSACLMHVTWAGDLFHPR